MTMSAKVFEETAKVIQALVLDLSTGDTRGIPVERLAGAVWTIETLADDFAALFASENERFDRERFFRAAALNPKTGKVEGV